MKKIYYLFLLLLCYSCSDIPDYNRHAYRHWFDYENAIQILGESSPAPKVEYIAMLLTSIDSIEIKVKGEKPKAVYEKSWRIAKPDGETIWGHKSQGLYEDFRFLLNVSKDEISYVYGVHEGLNNFKDEQEFLVLELNIDDDDRDNNRVYIYQRDVNMNKKERKLYDRLVQQEREQEAIFK